MSLLLTGKSAIGKVLDMAQPPEKYRDIEEKLGEPLADFVAARRAESVSWRRIANAILLKTGTDISDESLRMWFQGRQPVSTT